MATHSSVLAWRVPGTGEPGGAVSGVAQSRTRLKRLSSSSSSSMVYVMLRCIYLSVCVCVYIYIYKYFKKKTRGKTNIVAVVFWDLSWSCVSFLLCVCRSLGTTSFEVLFIFPLSLPHHNPQDIHSTYTVGWRALVEAMTPQCLLAPILFFIPGSGKM